MRAETGAVDRRLGLRRLSARAPGALASRARLAAELGPCRGPGGPADSPRPDSSQGRQSRRHSGAGQSWAGHSGSGLGRARPFGPRGRPGAGRALRRRPFAALAARARWHPARRPKSRRRSAARFRPARCARHGETSRRRCSCRSARLHALFRATSRGDDCALDALGSTASPGVQPSRGEVLNSSATACCDLPCRRRDRPRPAAARCARSAAAPGPGMPTLIVRQAQGLPPLPFWRRTASREMLWGNTARPDRWTAPHRPAAPWSAAGGAVPPLGRSV